MKNKNNKVLIYKAGSFGNKVWPDDVPTTMEEVERQLYKEVYSDKMREKEIIFAKEEKIANVFMVNITLGSRGENENEQSKKVSGEIQELSSCFINTSQ